MASNILNKKWRDYTLLEKVGVGMGLSVLGYAIYNLVTNKNVKSAPVDYGQIPVVYQSGGQSIKWDPDPLSKEIFQNIEGYNYFWTYPETADKITKLNSEQTKLLYNHYNQYYAAEYPTLTQLLDAEWDDWYGSYNAAVAHLKSYGLN